MLLYVHIPFCDSKCHYCSFNSFTHHHDLKRRYMSALIEQLRYELERFAVQKQQIETLFVGGGTPSTVKAQLFEPMFALLEPYLAKDCEITFEANPNSATPSWLHGIKTLGATRISFGVQSFDAEKLRFLGRAHSPDQAIAAIQYAAEAGIEHINCDIIYNVRGDSEKLLANDLAIAQSLPIDHISAYALTIEEGTPFARGQVTSHKEFGPFVAEHIHMPWYEVSNFGHYRSRHNMGYWQLKDYIGIGAGAVGFMHNRRFYPSRDLHRYIADPLACDIEELAHQDLRTEKIFLGLRSVVGVDAKLVNSQKAALLCDEGKLLYRDGRYYNLDFFLADEIALYLL